MRLSVGDWTRTVRRGDSAYVQFSLRQSRNPVTAITASLDGVAQLPGVGDGTADLRQVAGMYFTIGASMADGTHRLSVVASDGQCSDGDARVMVVQVVP